MGTGLVVPQKVSFSGLKNLRGWLKVTPNLAWSDLQLDSSACKIKTGEGHRKQGRSRKSHFSATPDTSGPGGDGTPRPVYTIF